MDRSLPIPVHGLLPSRYRFDPAQHADELAALFAAAESASDLSGRTLDRLLRRHPRRGRGFFSRSQLLQGLAWLDRRKHPAVRRLDLREAELRLRKKPVRTLSGVAPVTVFTRPHPCPGTCVFCPNDVRMPKSYLASEPGCQRAETHRFDPYRQTAARLRALANTGHRLDKVELLILGGTWTSYPESYRVRFVERCLAALNEVDRPHAAAIGPTPVAGAAPPRVDGRSLAVGESGSSAGYNQLLRQVGASTGQGEKPAAELDSAYRSLQRAQRENELASSRCVGLSVETRPDEISAAELVRLRRLGVTKVQLGVQSLDDRVLALNKRGHGSEVTRRAFALLRAAGFKIQAHWMPNLYGADPGSDATDFRRLFADAALRPDELKIYPCSLVESAELMRHWEAGRWRPYGHDELLSLVADCLEATPAWCRLSRVIRDIPGTEIVCGNKVTNLRQVAERTVGRRGGRLEDIRAREIRGRTVDPAALRLSALEYATSVGREVFLQWVTAEGRLAGFSRLALPDEGAEAAPPIDELAGAAILREVHVYGAVTPLGELSPRAAQHVGLGAGLVRRAAEWAHQAGFGRLAVISAIGTREWYRKQGFVDGDLYQHLHLLRSAPLG